MQMMCGSEISLSSSLRTSRYTQIQLCLGTQARSINEGGAIGNNYISPTNNEEIKSALLFGNCLVHSSVVFDRKLILAAGNYNEAYPKSQDYELWLRLRKNPRATFAVIDQVLVEKRVTCTNISALSWKKAKNPMLFRLWLSTPFPQTGESLFCFIITRGDFLFSCCLKMQNCCAEGFYLEKIR